MPKRRSGKRELRDEWYLYKVLRLYIGNGDVPEELRKVAVKMAEKQFARWKASYDKFSDAWWEKVKPVLERHGIPSADSAKYKAFTNAYISKVVNKRSRELDGLIRDFVVIHGCREEVLRDIVATLGEVIG